MTPRSAVVHRAPEGDIPVRVLRHPRWRAVRIHVDARGITVTAPKRASSRLVGQVVHQHAAWIEDARRRAPSLADPARDARRRRDARPLLVGLVEEWAPVVGVRPARVVVRNQRSRWGSASTAGTISLNWRLAHVPHEVAEYVVVHELCHLVHMNHSADFWACVEKHLPYYQGSREWLRRNGHAILAMDDTTGTEGTSQ